MASEPYRRSHQQREREALAHPSKDHKKQVVLLTKQSNTVFSENTFLQR